LQLGKLQEKGFRLYAVRNTRLRTSHVAPPQTLQCAVKCTFCGEHFLAQGW